MRTRQWALDGVNTKWLAPGRLCFARWWSNVYICGIFSLILPPPGIHMLTVLKLNSLLLGNGGRQNCGLYFKFLDCDTLSSRFGVIIWRSM